MNRLPFTALIRSRKRESHLLAIGGALSAIEQDALEGAFSASRIHGAATDIIRQAEAASWVCVLTQGWAARYLTTRQGGRQIIGFALPNEICNIDTISFETVGYGIRTMTPVTVRMATRDGLLAVCATYPGIAKALHQVSCAENAILGQWLLGVGRRPAIKRVAHLLCELAARLAAHGVAHDFPVPLTQEQISDALGLTAVHVNRSLQRLRTAGLLADRHTVSIRDFGRLSDFAEFDPAYLHVSSPDHTEEHATGTESFQRPPTVLPPLLRL